MIAGLTVLDTVALVLALLFAVRGAFKGFAWQAVRLAGLVAALWAAFALQAPVARWVGERFSFVPASAAPWVATIGIFLAIYFLAIFFAWIARGAVHRVHLGAPDRTLGFLLGAATGLVLLTIGFFVWGQVSSDDSVRAALDGSYAGRVMLTVTEFARPYLPEDAIRRWTAILETLKQVR